MIKTLDGRATQYKTYDLKNFRQISQLEKLSEERKFAMDVVGRVLPFRSNSYVVNMLIDWDKANPKNKIYARRC